METPAPKLDPGTMVKRIKAAIALTGLTQKEFAEALEQLGVDRTALQRMVRADSPNPPANIPEMTFAIAVSLAQVAGVPVEWFTEPDLSRLFTRQGTEPQLHQSVRDLQGQVEQLIVELHERDEQEQLDAATGQPTVKPNHEAKN